MLDSGHLIERQFPLTAAIPGIKLGLANSVLIYALYMLGIKQSVVLMLLKALMSWLIYTNMQQWFIRWRAAHCRCWR